MKFAWLAPLAIAASALLSACAPSADAPSLKAQTNLTLASIQKPTTWQELLRNLKYAVENGLPLRDDFYSNDNLKVFFNSSRISWSGKDTPNSAVELVAFDEEPAYRRYYIELHPPTSNPRALILVSGGRVQGTPIETVEDVFGTAIEVTDYPGPDYTGPPFPILSKTHRLGNARITFNSSLPTVKTTLIVITSANGTMRGLSAVVEKQ